MGQPITIQMRLNGLAQVQAGLKAVGNSFKGLFAPLAGVASVTAATTAITQLVRNSINMADEMGKLAQRAQAPVEAFSALNYAAKLADVSAGDLQVSYRFLAQWMRENGQGGLDLNEVFLEQADRIAGLTSGTDKLRVAQEVFGRGGQQMLTLLDQGGDAIRAQMQEAKELGIVIGPQMAADAAEFNDGFTRIRAIMEGVGLQLANVLLPEFRELQTNLINATKASGAQSDALNLLTGGYQFLAKQFATLNFTVTQATAGIAAFFGVIKGEEGPVDAFKRRLDELNGAWGEYVQRIQRIDALGTNAAEAIAGGVTDVGDVVAGGRFIADLGEERKLRRELLQLKQLEAATAGDFRLTEATKFQAKRDYLMREADLLAKINEELERQRKAAEAAAAATGDAEQASAARALAQSIAGRMDTTEGQLMGVNAQLGMLGPDPLSYRDQFAQVFTEIRELVQVTAKDIAGAFKNVIQSAVEGVSQSITGLIQGTMTWGNALRNIGTNILNGVINAISRMFAEWIVGRLAVKVVEIASSKAEAIAAAPAALLNSIKSYGVAALIGGAAFAAVMASFGAFADGGRPPLGVPSLVGERGPELFVPDTSGLIIPADVTASLLSGGGGGSPSVNVGGTRTVNNVTIAGLHDSKSEVFRALESAEGEAFMADYITGRIHRFTGRG